VWVLEAYKAYGGQYITMGSDAHRIEHVARGFDWAADMIRQAGFDRITYFEQRKPKFIKI
jgi:histidinol-phosphatase (PHP family)